MSRKGRKCGKLGLIMLCTGLAIILALLMPVGFWWLAAGIALVALGIMCIKSC